MHPFSLTPEQVEEVSGGKFDVIPPTAKIGEDGGGEETTLAIGEEGGLPPVDLT